jgi:hypothetical protein
MAQAISEAGYPLGAEVPLRRASLIWAYPCVLSKENR